jgi:hypothetical protein
MSPPGGSNGDKNNSNPNDFVIRDGFPALRKPNEGEGWTWWIDENEKEPIPRHNVWVRDEAISFESSLKRECSTPTDNHNKDTLDLLRHDCATVFTARSKESGAAYSTGTTYWLPCQMEPRCALESVVHSIFQMHLSDIDPRTYVPEQSGAEWWTLVLDESDDKSDSAPTRKSAPDASAAAASAGSDHDSDDEEDEGDEVGLHFDADYGLEDQVPNLLLHPRVATVTYLTDYGAPTVIFNRKSPHPSDTSKQSLAGSIDTIWVSHPRIGKHLAFDGRLLHGAPATYFPPAHDMPPDSDPKKDGDDEDAKPAASKKPRLGENVETTAGSIPRSSHVESGDPEFAHHARQRITLLVNIWLNHCPLDAEPLDDAVCQQLYSPWSNVEGARVLAKTAVLVPIQWNATIHDLKQETKWRTQSLSSSEAGEAAKSSLTAAKPSSEVICGHEVLVHYGTSLETLRKASQQAAGEAKEGSSSMKFQLMDENVIRLEIGAKVESDNDDEGSNQHGSVEASDASENDVHSRGDGADEGHEEDEDDDETDEGEEEFYDNLRQNVLGVPPGRNRLVPHILYDSLRPNTLGAISDRLDADDGENETDEEGDY